MKKSFFSYILHFQTFFRKIFKDKKPVHIQIHIQDKKLIPGRDIAQRRYSENM